MWFWRNDRWGGENSRFWRHDRRWLRYARHISAQCQAGDGILNIANTLVARSRITLSKLAPRITRRFLTSRQFVIMGPTLVHIIRTLETPLLIKNIGMVSMDRFYNPSYYIIWTRSWGVLYDVARETMVSKSQLPLTGTMVLHSNIMPHWKRNVNRAFRLRYNSKNTTA